MRGKWLHYNHPRVDRDYELFEKMAGVRGHAKNAIALPKGLPDDATETTLFDREEDDGDAHSTSWLSSKEFSDVIVDLHAKRALRSLHHGQRYGGLDADFGWLFGGSFTYFVAGGIGDYPEQLEDYRVVFWFDN